MALLYKFSRELGTLLLEIDHPLSCRKVSVNLLRGELSMMLVTTIQVS